VPLKRATDSAARAGGVIERTLAPCLEELAGEIRGLRGEMQQLDKRVTENFTSLRNETVARIEALEGRLNGRIDTLSERTSAFERRMDDHLAAIDRRLDERLGGLDDKIALSSKRFDEALDIRERLASLEAKVEAQNATACKHPLTRSPASPCSDRGEPRR
jgi:chromosome segregation ATPase